MRALWVAFEGTLSDRLRGLRVTIGVGAPSSVDGDKNVLIADADAALCAAGRQDKSPTVRAEPETANVLSGE